MCDNITAIQYDLKGRVSSAFLSNIKYNLTEHCKSSIIKK